MGHSFRPLLDYRAQSRPLDSREPPNLLQKYGDLDTPSERSKSSPGLCTPKPPTRSDELTKHAEIATLQSLPETQRPNWTTPWQRLIARQQAYRKRLGASVTHQETTHGCGYQQIVLDLAAVTNSENLAALKINCSRSSTVDRPSASKSETTMDRIDKAFKFKTAILPSRPSPDSLSNPETFSPNAIDSIKSHPIPLQSTAAHERGGIEMIDQGR